MAQTADAAAPRLLMGFSQDTPETGNSRRAIWTSEKQTRGIQRFYLSPSTVRGRLARNARRAVDAIADRRDSPASPESSARLVGTVARQSRSGSAHLSGPRTRALKSEPRFPRQQGRWRRPRNARGPHGAGLSAGAVSLPWRAPLLSCGAVTFKSPRTRLRSHCEALTGVVAAW